MLSLTSLENGTESSSVINPIFTPSPLPGAGCWNGTTSDSAPAEEPADGAASEPSASDGVVPLSGLPVLHPVSTPTASALMSAVIWSVRRDRIAGTTSLRGWNGAPPSADRDRNGL